MWKKELLICLLLIILSFPAVRALLAPGGFTSHDLTHHIVRQISMDKLLSEGQFPPRWSGELNNGYGYPVFLFNYPLPAMFGEIFHKMGLGFVDSVKAVLFSSMILSVLGMYLFLKSLLGSKLAAFLGAIFYLYAPLRFLNVYVSAAVGGALALGIVPFVFWAILRGKTVLGSVFLAALILSHNVTALIFAPLIILFARKNLKIILLGLGLSAWFWMPAVLEKQYTRFDEVFGNFYQDQFPSLQQLIRSPWGYGLSHPALPEPGDMSYQIGLVHIGVILVLLSRIKSDRLVVFVLAVFALSIFLMLKISLPLWENLPFLSMVQFPLRFQAISIFAASIAAGLLIKYLPFKKILFFSLLFLVIYANRNHWHINQVFDPGEDYYLNLKTTSTTYGEHLPKWGKIYDSPSPGKLEFVSGGSQIRMLEDKSHRVMAEIESTSAATLRFNQIYFPGWELKVDNKSYSFEQFDIDAGKHIILAEFKNTLVRNLADGISLATVIVFLYAGYNKRFDKWQKSVA